ncbi:MAG: nicotinate-nucleotide adenylyltransferase [Bacillota bacterium]|nr:nicotinate-nucleotide adenylyltransferase [Bacillota bacterium]
MKKTGILGGTFDPVHLGHLGLAGDAMEQVGLDEIILIPAKLQPFKLDKKITPGKDRLAMLRLATEDFPDFKVSDYEMTQEGVSYTYLTMRAMQQQEGPDAHLYFITGTDTFLKIETWKEATELLSSYSFIVGTRPGYRREELETCIERICCVYNTVVRNIDNVQLDISSTDIRKRLETGTSAEDLIPRKVERYIIDHGLYRE